VNERVRINVIFQLICSFFGYQHPFIKKAKTSACLLDIIQEANEIIKRVGSRELALGLDLDKQVSRFSDLCECLIYHLLRSLFFQSESESGDSDNENEKVDTILFFISNHLLHKYIFQFNCVCERERESMNE
jgi:hypothetical protein